MIGGLNKLQVGLIAITLIGIVLFLIAPRLPKESVENATEIVAVDAEVQEAVDMINGGGPPMQGILKLKEIHEKNPDNIDAAWYLGVFSIQSGQYENAIKRFGQVLEHDKNGKYNEAHVYLGQTHATLGDSKRAIASFNEYIELESDTSLTNKVRGLITELEKTR
jgi:tetratricopeptide (TPR) repeat protein